jgi:hypothetical protein
MLIDERRDVVAYVENEPDGDEAGDAVKIHLQEIANDVSVEEFHCDLDGLVSISVLKSMARAKSRQKKNDEIRMTKIEGMTNDQMTKGCGVAFFVIRALDFIGHWSFVLRHL